MEAPYIFAGALALTAGCAIVAKRLALPYPIVFVLAGSAAAFVPGVPALQLDPQLVFNLVLPPLLFNGGWTTDSRLFRAKWRPIFLLAIGLVAVTAVAVALCAHVLGFAWAPAFVLGAIVSPPDAVAGMAIFERFAIPRAVLTILNGEGLVNDGIALVLYGFAVSAAVTGHFSLGTAALAVPGVAVGGVAAGLLVAAGVDLLTRALGRSGLGDSLIDNLVFLVAPYAAYFAAEAVGASGVLSAVAAGVAISRRAAVIYGPQTRLIGSSVWNLLDYLLNGFMFLAIGLQVRDLLRDAPFLRTHAAFALAVAGIAIAVRIVWVFAAVDLPLRLGSSSKAGSQSWRYTTVIAWTGLRGIISLASAFGLPLHDAAGHGFPERDAIVFTAYIVILVTLVGQGLALIPLLSFLRIAPEEDAARRELEVRVRALEAGIDRLQQIAADGSADGEDVDRIVDEYRHRIDHVQRHAPDHPESEASVRDHDLQEEALAAERRTILHLRDDGRIPDEVFRRIEYDLDLAETRLR